MSRSNTKNHVLTSLLPCFKVKGRGQGQRSVSRVKVKGRGQILACSGRYWGLGFAKCSQEQQESLPV